MPATVDGQTNQTSAMKEITFTDTNDTAQPSAAATATGSTDATPTRVIAKDDAPMKDMLAQEGQRERECGNIPFIIMFWLHFLGMLIFIIYIFTAEPTGTASGVLKALVDFLTKDSSGRKLLGCMLGTCFCGVIFAYLWVYFLKCWKDNSIKMSIIVYHFVILGLFLWAVFDEVWFIFAWFAVILFFTDLWLLFQKDNFPFSEAMMRIGVAAITKNCKMQTFAYMFMPLQIALYLFWWLGWIFTFTFDWGLDLWWLILLVFVYSYNWTGYFMHFIIHSFISTLSGYWILGMTGGYNKASQSLKSALCTGQGPISIGSMIMAFLHMIKTAIRTGLRCTCCCCGEFVWQFACNCLNHIMQRYNEYVLTEVSLLGLGFFDASVKVTQLFQSTGMQIITNEVAWDVPLTVGKIIGFCMTGALGLGFFHWSFGDDIDYDSKEAERAGNTFIWFMFGIIGSMTVSLGLEPLRSALTSVFVVWAEEPQSFARGQPELYIDLMESVDKCPKIQNILNVPDCRDKTGKVEHTV